MPEKYTFEQAQNEAEKIKKEADQSKKKRGEEGEPDREDYEKAEQKEQREQLDEEKKEFLESLLVPERMQFIENIRSAFGIDERHSPAFLTGLVYLMNREQLQEIKEISVDCYLKEAFNLIKEFLRELNEIYQQGEFNPDRYAEIRKIEKLMSRTYVINNIGLEEDLKEFGELLEIFTGKTLQKPDFILEKTQASDLKNDPQLGQYIEYVDNFFDDFLKEKILQHQEIFFENSQYDADFLLSPEGLELIKKYNFIPLVSEPGYVPPKSRRERSTKEAAIRSNADIIFKNIRAAGLEKLKQFAKSKPMEGKSVFEIGGEALAVYLEIAGAKAVSFDAEGFSWSSWGRTLETTRVSNTMNSENYQSILDKIDPGENHQFDLTTSRMLFDDGSGIESTVPSKKYDDAAEEILKVLSKITKPGGLSIHQTGFSYSADILKINETEELKKLGFKKKFVLWDRGEIEKKFLYAKEKFYTLEELPSDFECPTVVLERL